VTPERWSRTESMTLVQSTELDQPDHASQTKSGRLVRAVPLVVPIILVNAFAVFGQSAWALSNITSNRTVAVLFAAALESTAIYLAYEAHVSLMSGDAALKLRLSSYGIAALVGALNYSHWSDHWAPNAKSVVFAGFSIVSPWLWSIRSRSMRRADLRAQGLIDPRSVRFSAARWTLYPVRTFRAFRRAVWDGTVDPSAAIRAVDQTRSGRLVQSSTETVSVEMAVQSTGPGLNQPGPPGLDPVQTGLGPDRTGSEPPSSDPVQTGSQTRSAVATRTTRKAIQSTGLDRSHTGSRDDRSIDQLAAEIATAVQAGNASDDLSVEAARRLLRVGKPKARAAIEAYGRSR
jgi:Protein of unknown function (DUF2637)